MCVENPISLLFSMPIINIFETGKFLEAIVVVRVVYDEVFCLFNKPSQKYANLLETWEIWLPTVWNSPLVLTNWTDIFGEVGIVPKFRKKLPKSFRRNKLPKPVERSVGGSAAKL